jgi:hypothetical protein
MNNPDSREPYPFDLPQPSPERINLDVISSPETGLGRLDAEIPQRAELPQSTPPDPAATISNLPPSMLFTSPDPPVLNQAEEKVDKEEKDLIAKEWVSRTKEIIATTRNDPYRQNRELFRIKADFMKTRYNKDVVMDEN